jgi:hypothetical protein
VVPISSDDVTNSTESDGEYNSELDPVVDMHMEDDVDAPDSIDLDGDVDMERDDEHEEEEDEKNEDEEEVEVDQDEQEDKDENDGKEPRTMSQGEMVNTSAGDVHTMLDAQPIVLPETCQEMREHTTRPQPQGAAPRPQIPDTRPRPRTPQTHPVSGLEYLRIVILQKPHPAEPTPPQAEAAGNTSAVDVDQQLLIKSAGGNCRPDVPLPVARPDGSGGVELTSSQVVEKAMVVGFGFGSGSCLVRFLCSTLLIARNDYYMRREVFRSLKVYFIDRFCVRFILLVLVYS